MDDDSKKKEGESKSSDTPIAMDIHVNRYVCKYFP